MKNIYFEKNSDIQILRAVAIIITLAAHINILTKKQELLSVMHVYFEYWAGVDLFFCISGFVITSSLLRQYSESQDIHQKVKNIRNFWIKRFYRIAPSSWLWLTITLFVAYNLDLQVNESPSEVLRQSLIAFLNLFNFEHTNCLYSDGWHCTVLGIYWSLSLEEQFYFLFPFVFFFIRHKYLAFILLFVCILMFFIHRPWPGLGWSTRIDPVFWGVIIAFFKSSSLSKIMEPRFLQNRLTSFLFLIVCILLLISIPRISPDPQGNILVFETSLIGIICALLVGSASYDGNYFSKKSIITTIFLWIGSRSYSLYLNHIIIFLIIRDSLNTDQFIQNSRDFIILTACAISVSCLLAEGNYRFVELPLRLKGRQIVKSLKD